MDEKHAKSNTIHAKYVQKAESGRDYWTTGVTGRIISCWQMSRFCRSEKVRLVKMGWRGLKSKDVAGIAASPPWDAPAAPVPSHASTLAP